MIFSIFFFLAVIPCASPRLLTSCQSSNPPNCDGPYVIAEQTGQKCVTHPGNPTDGKSLELKSCCTSKCSKWWWDCDDHTIRSDVNKDYCIEPERPDGVSDNVKLKTYDCSGSNGANDDTKFKGKGSTPGAEGRVEEFKSGYLVNLNKRNHYMSYQGNTPANDDAIKLYKNGNPDNDEKMHFAVFDSTSCP